MSDDERCPCGQPLHYKNAELRLIVTVRIAHRGSVVYLTRDSRAWLVSTHYVALHGMPEPCSYELVPGSIELYG